MNAKIHARDSVLLLFKKKKKVVFFFFNKIKTDPLPLPTTQPLLHLPQKTPGQFSYLNHLIFLTFPKGAQ